MERIKMSNLDAANRAEVAERFADRTGLLGFACARNARKLTEATIEYIKARSGALEELGEQIVDRNGLTTGYRISPAHDNFAKFRERMSPLDGIEVEVEVLKVPASEVMDKMNGNDAMTIEWMIDEEGL